MIANTKIHHFEISIASHHCDDDGKLNIDNVYSNSIHLTVLLK